MNKYIKQTSKQGQRIARERAGYYLNGGGWHYATDIYEAYKSPSVYKVRAWEYCKDLCRKLHGRDLRIVGWNSMKFSVAFRFNERGTGRECYAYITADYDRFCYANDETSAGNASRAA